MLPLISKHTCLAGRPSQAPNMKVVVNNLTSKIVDSDVALFVDKVMGLREEKKLWESLDIIIKFYRKKYPNEYRESVEISRDLRKSRGDEWGRGEKSLHKESRRANLRMVMNLPFRLIAIIRKVYSEEELPFDRKFLRRFGIKYPEFLVPQKGVGSFS